MAHLRKIALALLLSASAVVLLLAAWDLWSDRQRVYVPANQRSFSSGARTRILQDRLDLLAMRVDDMELLVLILLGTSGLYAIVFVTSAYFSATSFGRHADQTIKQMRDQMGAAMERLHELQEDTEKRVRATPETPLPAGSEAQIAAISRRVAGWQDRALSEQSRLELIEDERTVACLEVVTALRDSSSLATLYFGLARIYGPLDPARSHFYLERALRLAAPESELASEIHYRMACRLAASQDYSSAMRELSAAFAHQFKGLDEQLASDIEEGGGLYELASTAPFDKVVNDLLLNMSIGIG